jgi:hypothetical protein
LRSFNWFHRAQAQSFARFSFAWFLLIGVAATVRIMMPRMSPLLSCALMLGLAVTLSTRAGSFHGPPGLQLYSLRESFNQDVPGTLDRVKAFGFANVELAGTDGKSPEQFHELLAARGLNAIAGHFS